MPVPIRHRSRGDELAGSYHPETKTGLQAIAGFRVFEAI